MARVATGTCKSAAAFSAVELPSVGTSNSLDLASSMKNLNSSYHIHENRPCTAYNGTVTMFDYMQVLYNVTWQHNINTACVDKIWRRVCKNTSCSESKQAHQLVVWVQWCCNRSCIGHSKECHNEVNLQVVKICLRICFQNHACMV